MAIGDTRDALAALVGGGIAALLSTYVVARVWGLSDAEPKAVLGAFIRAEFGKFVLGAVAFVIAATLFRTEFLAVITTFFVALQVYWVALLWQHD